MLPLFAVSVAAFACSKKSEKPTESIRAAETASASTKTPPPPPKKRDGYALLASFPIHGRLDRLSADGAQLRIEETATDDPAADATGVSIYDRSGKQVSQHALAANVLAASFDGAVQLLPSAGDSVDRLDVASGARSKLKSSTLSHGEQYGALAISDDGKLVAGLEGVFELDTGKPVCPLEPMFAGGSDPGFMFVRGSRFLYVANSRAAFLVDLSKCAPKKPAGAIAVPIAIPVAFDVSSDGSVILGMPGHPFATPYDDSFHISNEKGDELRKLPLTIPEGTEKSDQPFSGGLTSKGDLALVVTLGKLHVFTTSDGKEAHVESIADLFPNAGEALTLQGADDAVVIASRKRVAILALR